MLIKGHLPQPLPLNTPCTAGGKLCKTTNLLFESACGTFGIDITIELGIIKDSTVSSCSVVPRPFWFLPAENSRTTSLKALVLLEMGSIFQSGLYNSFRQFLLSSWDRIYSFMASGLLLLFYQPSCLTSLFCCQFQFSVLIVSSCKKCTQTFKPNIYGENE